uniref:Enkurin domain-containing protein n=1 Tax=Maylandia zebra TaxID=106582 RepID=A0A3P9D9C8_9CICH
CLDTQFTLPPPKPKMYISKYREAIVLENKYKNEHRTMVPRTVKAPSHREMCPQRPEGEKPEHTFRKKPEHTGMKKVMAQPACVDTRKGDKQLLEKSGLKEKAKQDNDAWLTKQQETVKPLAEQEKQNILQGLKRRFNELNFEYQSLPFTISPSQHKKYNYKMFLEEAMSQVEKDIALFEEHKYIYTSDAFHCFLKNNL